MIPQKQPRRPAGKARGDAAEEQRNRSTARVDVHAIAVEVLRHLLELVSRPALYSNRRGHGAPGYSEEANRALAKLIGTRRGRYWVYTAEQLEAYERRETPTVAAVATVKPWTARDALESVGLHATRRAS
jgi:hypothetical protein